MIKHNVGDGLASPVNIFKLKYAKFKEQLKQINKHYRYLKH